MGTLAEFENNLQVLAKSPFKKKTLAEFQNDAQITPINLLSMMQEFSQHSRGILSSKNGRQMWSFPEKQNRSSRQSVKNVIGSAPHNDNTQLVSDAVLLATRNGLYFAEVANLIESEGHPSQIILNLKNQIFD